MYTKKIRVVLAYAVLCITSSLACAGTVDFNVPVEVKSYPPDGKGVLVWCELRSLQNQVIASNGTNSMNSILLKLIGGAYSGSMHVKLEYKPEEAVNIRNYRCALVDASSLKNNIPGPIPVRRNNLAAGEWAAQIRLALNESMGVVLA